jgi:hypothetical protein
LNVFFDVQGTLLAGGVPRPCVREVFLELGTRGHDVYLWSSAGAGYAERAAELLGVGDVVLGCWSKNPPPPVVVDYVVDDHRDFAEHHGGYAIAPFEGDSEDRELCNVLEAIEAAGV